MGYTFFLLGRESSILNGIDVPESYQKKTDEHTDDPTQPEEIEFITIPFDSVHEAQTSKSKLQVELHKLQVQLIKREIYARELVIFEKERILSEEERKNVQEKCDSLFSVRNL